MKTKNIKQTFLWTDLLVIAGVIAVGCVLLPLSSGWAALGGTIVAIGIAMIPFFHHGYKIKGHHGIFKREEILVPRDYKDSILTFLQGNQEKLDLAPGTVSGGLVEIYWRGKDKDLLARYFDYQLHLEGTDFPLHKITQQQAQELKRIQTQIALF